MEFLVNIKVNIPHDLPDSRRVELQKAELARAAELAAEGTLKRLWRVPGRRENFGLWKAANATVLHNALASLPMFPHMEIDVTALAGHPADPAPEGE